MKLSQSCQCKDGRDGRDGKDGRDGLNGNNGKNGLNGLDGKPGSSVADSGLKNWRECAWYNINEDKDIGLVKVITLIPEISARRTFEQKSVRRFVVA